MLSVDEAARDGDLDELIRHAKSKGKVWFATHEQVARYAKEHAA